MNFCLLPSAFCLLPFAFNILTPNFYRRFKKIWVRFIWLEKCKATCQFQ